MKLTNFVKLDILSLKEFFGIRTGVFLLITVLVFTFIGVFLKAHIPHLYLMLVGCVLFMAGAMPFTNEEKNDINTFYITQNVARDTVVKGRFLFSISISFFAALGGTIFDIINLVITGYFAEIKSVFVPAVLLFLGILIYNAITFPIYFKVGFLKGRFLAVFVPMIMIMIVISSFIILSLFQDAMPVNINNIALIFIVAAAAVITTYFSILLSMKFYSKREF
jgi:hypothetical protein